MGTFFFETLSTWGKEDELIVGTFRYLAYDSRLIFFWNCHLELRDCVTVF